MTGLVRSSSPREGPKVKVILELPKLLSIGAPIPGHVPFLCAGETGTTNGWTYGHPTPHAHSYRGTAWIHHLCGATKAECPSGYSPSHAKQHQPGTPTPTFT